MRTCPRCGFVLRNQSGAPRAIGNSLPWCPNAACQKSPLYRSLQTDPDRLELGPEWHPPPDQNGVDHPLTLDATGFCTGCQPPKPSGPSTT